jgi:hypothetical protein
LLSAAQISGDADLTAFLDRRGKVVRPRTPNERCSCVEAALAPGGRFRQRPSATEIAEAEYQLHRIRRTKIAIIERAMSSDDPPRRLGSELLHARLVQSDLQPERNMSSQEQLRTAGAIQRVLPELGRLERYECRAASNLSRAVRRLRNEKIGSGANI